MPELFGYEKLIVYQKEMRFAVVRGALLAGKLGKATTAIPLNIAEGTGRFSGADQAKFFGIAYKAAIQSSAIVDLAAVSAAAEPSRVEDGRKSLRRIAAMLTSLSKVASDEN